MKILRYFLLVTLVATWSADFRCPAVTVTNLTLAIPGASWALEIDTPGFDLTKSGISPDGSAAQLAAVNAANGLALSAFVEKAASEGDAKKCRDYYSTRMEGDPFVKGLLTTWETNQLAFLEYTVQTGGLDQQNMNVYLSTNGAWIDIHISKTGYKPADDARFDAIVKSIRINDDYLTSPLQNVFWGSFYMAQSNFVTAIRCDERALALDNAHPSLGPLRHLLVMEDVINCYGSMNDNAKAKNLSLAALKEYPDYPGFYYALACSHAGLGDKTNALDCLKKAFQNKAKLYPGDELSDPRADWSFTKYANDPAFMEFYATLKK